MQLKCVKNESNICNGNPVKLSIAFKDPQYTEVLNLSFRKLF